MNFYIGKILYVIILLHISEFSMQRSKKFCHLIKFTKNLNLNNQGCTPICAYGRWPGANLYSASANHNFIKCQGHVQTFQGSLPTLTFPRNFFNFVEEPLTKILGGKYKFALAAHIDKGYIHNYLIFNVVSITDHIHYQSNYRIYHKIIKYAEPATYLFPHPPALKICSSSCSSKDTRLSMSLPMRQTGSGSPAFPENQYPPNS